MNDLKWTIVGTVEEFDVITSDWGTIVSCDTETFGKIYDKSHSKLLGISLCSGNSSIYIPVWVYNKQTWEHTLSPSLHARLSVFFKQARCVGHNFTYDKAWLLKEGFLTEWHADTRLMWHMASAPAGPRPYGLKDAQKEVLGWPASNEGELKVDVEAKGGKLSNGDHYLADLRIMAKYACLDTYSTLELYKRLLPFFEHHSYIPLLRSIMAYNQLLEENAGVGVGVDVGQLIEANRALLEAKERHRVKFLKSLASEIGELEEDWKDRKLADYKREYNKTHYLANPDKWKRFNMNSDAHKRELFYGKLHFPVIETTEGGKPSTGADAIKLNQHPSVKEYLQYEKANTLSTNFTGPYLDSIHNGRLHPGFNICGTVSYRLSGFKPYLLNAPFDEKEVMKAFVVDEGYIGLHTDLAAIEPTITAHYSEDPALLKVFRDGLGDIYLDLALYLFPTDKELHEGYNPNIPVTKAVKERFSKQRKISKVIQLAVQYTGTGSTVARNLSKDGIPTSRAKADGYVRAYWQKFEKVRQFNFKLKELNRVQGLLRNVIGRIIRVPDPNYKDLSNRFIQSSAHDCLILIILEIDRLRKERNVDMKPLLIDCHDSTSWQVRKDQIHLGEEIFKDALTTVNKELDLIVTIRAETKRFSTFAGLKAEET